MAEVSTADGLSIRIAERDASALGELYDALAPGLMGLLLRILGERSEAEQVLDEVFVQLWDRAPAAGSDRTSVTARLVVMARAAAVERLRAHRAPASAAAVRNDANLLLRASSAWLPKPEEITALDERRELLKRIIRQLSGTQRQALELAVFEGYTEIELAEKLGEPLGKVRTELRASMRFLRHRVRAVLGTWSTSI
ncbi:MAG TPA: sigma-70 family RNA polymerase sigma factor [Terriglobia bacterium]|nr:sigma-70 family RNA polymerase sigma factor [Terriglobia bacterium]